MDTGSIIKLATLCVFIIVGIASRIWLIHGSKLDHISESVIKDETRIGKM